MCVCVCVCMHEYVCLRPCNVTASSVWNSWNVRGQINDVLLKTLLSLQVLRRYFKMKNQTFLTSYFIPVNPQLDKCASRLQIVRPSFTIIRHRPRSALIVNLWGQTLTRGVAI